MRRRAALVVLAALAVLMAGTASVRAGDPTLGGTLGASRDAVIIDSSASIPVDVELIAPEGWTLGETRFAMLPGERRAVPVLVATDDPVLVIAHMSAAEDFVGTDRSTLVLSVGLPRPDVPLPLWPLPVFAVLFGALAYIARREWRRSRGYMTRYEVMRRMGR